MLQQLHFLIDNTSSAIGAINIRRSVSVNAGMHVAAAKTPTVGDREQSELVRSSRPIEESCATMVASRLMLDRVTTPISLVNANR